MYIVITKLSDKSAIFLEKASLSKYIGKSVDTIRRKQGLTKWETNEFIIYNPSIVKIKSNIGSKTKGFINKKV